MQLTIDGADAVVADLDGMSSKALRGAVRAMNRAIASGRTVMSREIARDLGLGVGVVRDAMPISQATRHRAEAAFRAGLQRIPLIDFKAKALAPSRKGGRGRGVSYRLPSGKGRLPQGFIATMASGHRGVFARRARSRLPIVEQFGPSLGQVFAKYRPIGRARTQEAFDTAFAHELARLTQPSESTRE